MKIFPDYKHYHICHYCKANKAEEEYQYEERWYGVLNNKVLPPIVEFISVDVSVPRCKECYKRHNIASLPTYVIGSISFILGVYFLFFKDKESGWADTWYSWALGLILVFFISGALAYVVGTPIRYIITSLFYSNKYSDQGVTRDYEPIRKLIGCGFNFEKPDAVKDRGCRKISIDRFNETIISIITKDKCHFKK